MWEYKTWTFELESLDYPGNYMQLLGQEGWEAYSSFPSAPYSERIVVMFKRPIKKGPQVNYVDPNATPFAVPRVEDT